ncbi:MAG TPA: DUF3467 domain-containing protein [Nitrospiria bacterium]|nr:DUF3467 domain-containing protein [Nitrospiria bacterium]
MTQPNQPNPPLQIQVELDDATAQGIYTNLALVAHTETEFLFDFLFVQPQQPKAKVRARIISSPTHTKRFFLALRENITRYEVRFGEIKVPDDSPGARDLPHE